MTDDQFRDQLKRMADRAPRLPEPKHRAELLSVTWTTP